MLGTILGLLLTVNIPFTPPVDDEITLAGNFGEPRPHHFHGGVDIKTGGVEGKHVYAIADGYVSRVTKGLFGFGNAVYITHPTGQTSVYCHLKDFSPRIKRLFRKWQYAHETCSTDATFGPLECPVSQGQLIAISGNTGFSSAPHLHLEIHDTKTWDMLDPLDFIGYCVSDETPPTAHGLMAYPQQGEGVFNGGSIKQTFGFSSHHLERPFTAWGKVGFGIWANDYMESTYNPYGVRETILTVDGDEVFHAVVDQVPVSKNRLINSWGDYEHWIRFKTWYLKSFVEPGNTLPIFLAVQNRGIVDFCQERDYHLEYILRDFKGNESRYTFTVRGERHDISRSPAPQGKVMRWNRINSYSESGMQLIIPSGLLATDMILRPYCQRQPDRLSDAYRFSPTSCPLVTDGEILFYPHRKVKDPSKLYVCSGGHYMGGTYENGWVKGRIRELGQVYELDYDDEAPVISAISLGDRLSLSVSDPKSGVKSYQAYMDGQFVVFEPMEKSSVVVCDLRETPVRKTGKSRHLKFIATDYCDNTRTYETTINY